MLHITSKGLSLADLRTSPITDIMALYFKYQTASEETCHGMPRALAFASDLHAVLEGTEFDYTVRFLNRRYTISVYNRHQEYFELTEEMHRFEIIRVTETEEGR